MNSVERLLFDEAVESLQAEGELAQREGAFSAESPLPEAFQILGLCVLRAVDDA